MSMETAEIIERILNYVGYVAIGLWLNFLFEKLRRK